MEGRPPFDPDEDLDFDFEASRRRWKERTDEHEIARRTGEQPAIEPEEAGSEPAGEPGPGDDDAPRRRERRPRRKAGFSLGRRRKPGPGRRGRGRETGERAALAPPEEAAAPPGAAELEPNVLAPDTAERRRLRDDPFTPAKVPVPGERRSSRRDLPAKVRRRQAIALGAVALIVVVGAIALLSGGGGGGDEEEPLALKRLIGQSVIGKLGKGGVDETLLRRARKGQIGGVIVQPRNEQALQQDLAQLQEAADAGGNPPLLALIDQEGGEIKDLPGGPPEASPADLGEGGDAEAARAEGEKTGSFLKPLGVDVDLAPVLDVRLPQTADTIAGRTFSDDPAVVGEMGTAFIEGLQSQGVAATAKHFPGLGPATINTDFSPVTIAARAEDLDAALEPFRAAVEAGVDLVMVSSAIYPAYGGSTPKDPNRPAVFTKQVVEGMLRGDLGFTGVVVSDDLQSIAIQQLADGVDTAAVQALQAGCDLVLYAGNAQGSVDGFNAVLRAAKKGTLTRERLQQSYDRIAALKTSLAS